MDFQRGERNGERDSSRQAESAVYFSNPLMSDIESDWSPLHDAAYHGRLVSVRTLIDQGASTNLVSLERVSPLHVACLQGHTVCAKLLLDHGANVNITTVDGSTALSESCGGGHLSCVRLLLQHGSTPHGPTDSSSPIHQAAAKGHVDCVEALVQQGADVDRRSEYLGTPLYTACANQHLSMVKRLLQLGADVNSGKGGDTPLHLGAQRDWPELVTTLLEHGANAHARDTAGNQPLDLAPPNSAAKTLLNQRGGVSRLAQLSRLTVRRVLGPARLCKISSLSLPSELKEYLLYQSD
ncbi:ankyrin repeat and SOCS box protein 9-like isoform X2 [Conger conger]|nr:ankyrin repeat and SOCS box protein 9-like isoform X2 [Conger conger]XP_061083185.1 ankyrin repeat and SOCS box protein 9-like isoform X2 [Conger conger]